MTLRARHTLVDVNVCMCVSTTGERSSNKASADMTASVVVLHGRQHKPMLVALMTAMPSKQPLLEFAPGNQPGLQGCESHIEGKVN